MGRNRVLKSADLVRTPPLALPAGLRRGRPRSYFEWKTLREWNRLPEWEGDPTGYRLRGLREAAGLTQAELAARLSCSQQAVAQAERWDANPSVRFLERWARALGLRLELRFQPTQRGL